MKSIKEHVGFVVGDGYNERAAAAAIKKIVAAEAAGIRQIWMNQGHLDTLTIFAAATSAFRNSNCTDVSASSVGFGTAGLGFERYCTRSVAAWNRP
jgi:hypothetical protein